MNTDSIISLKGRPVVGRTIRFMTLALAAAATICALGLRASPEGAPPRQGVPYRGFHDPKRVTIRGYSGHAMEPFITRHGNFLLFNNLNEAPENTNLHYAARIDDLTFEYKGEVKGVNTAFLEGVPSMDLSRTLYFVSTRSYGTTFSTIYRGKFEDGTVTGIELVEGVSPKKPGIVDFDAEVSEDGNTLYFVDGDFTQDPKPFAADIVIASKKGNGFQRDPKSAEILKNVNSDALEYAPSISRDRLELFFTRIDRKSPNPLPTIYRAARKRPDEPFDIPQRVEAAEGFVEAPSLDATGHVLYFHKLDGDRRVIYRATR